MDSDPPPHPDDEARLRDLGAKLRARELSGAPTTSGGNGEGASNAAVGLKYASEFAGAVIVTTVVGYFIDRVAGSSPWGLLGGLLLGTVAGLYSIVRSARDGME